VARKGVILSLVLVLLVVPVIILYNGSQSTPQSLRLSMPMVAFSAAVGGGNVGKQT
jgi:hypothetical protein